jgi:hypothetical protein
MQSCCLRSIQLLHDLWYGHVMQTASAGYVKLLPAGSVQLLPDLCYGHVIQTASACYVKLLPAAA